MAFWQRFLITLAAMLVASFIIGLVWHRLSGFSMPDYVAGVVGGFTALPLWEFLKRVKLKE